jgi:hypothetical protein
MLSRGFFREQGANPYLIDGTQKTCLQDSLIVAARHAGIEVSKSQVYKDLEEEAGEANGQELQVAVAVMYAREKVSPFSCSMTCMHGLTHS